MNRHTTLPRLLAPALIALAGFAAAPAARATDVGVSIGFSQPGVYGRVDIGRYPQPVLITQQPVVIGRPVYREPVYLWVPPAHRGDWRHNCYRYNACGAPVYFVENNWYQREVVIRERDRHDHGRGHDRDRDRHDRDHGRDHGWDHGRDRDRDHDRRDH